MKQDWRTIDTDLLVIGGGVAGSMAAIPALEAGLTVTICEKGRVLDNCGSVGCGVDHYLTIMESGPEWDTPEFLLKHIPDLTDGIVDMAVTTRVVREMPRILRKIEGMGVDFKDPKTGDYARHRSFGLPGAYHINFDGTDFKRRIGKHVRVGKATVLTRTMAVQLLVKDNRAYGALAFGFRDGTWTAIRAKAVALTAGDVNRISRNASGLAFDSWHFPYNTGDAQAMGYRAGAALANMEFVETTLTPKGFSAQGLNALVSLGAYFVNKSGERFMFKYDPKGENARRAVLADAVVNEYLLGNGPIFVDCRHLPPELLDHMDETLQVDRYTLPAYYQQKGVSFRDTPIEISISELSIRRSGVYFRGSGLAVDTNGETSVERLFAAGDCATVSGGIAGAAVLGHIAGEGAAARIAGRQRRAAVDRLGGCRAQSREEARASMARPRRHALARLRRPAFAKPSPTMSACAAAKRACGWRSIRFPRLPSARATWRRTICTASCACRRRATSGSMSRSWRPRRWHARRRAPAPPIAGSIFPNPTTRTGASSCWSRRATTGPSVRMVDTSQALASAFGRKSADATQRTVA